MYILTEVIVHGKTKYQILINGQKHLCYLNSKEEAQNVVRHLNRKA